MNRRRTAQQSSVTKNQESGYALLLVFAMAAIVAAMLYLQLPRVAFEAQRNKEELLIERGEQYQRAIQLYYRKFKRYPATLEQLDNTNNVRFLRRRYTDPMTGKAEWRIIHIGAAGTFTDSKTKKSGQEDKDKKKEDNRNAFITELPTIGSTLADVRQQGGPVPRRQSEGGQAPGAESGVIVGTNPGQPGQDAQTGVLADGTRVTAPPAGAQGIPQQPVSSFPGVPGMPYPGGVVPPQPGIPGTASPGAIGSVNPGAPQGMDPTQPGANQAADMIRNLLTKPRQFPGGGAAPGGLAAGPMQMAPGIAGVASTAEKPSIKIYNEREKYDEWEFIYDFSKDRTGAGQFAGNLGSGDPRLQQGTQAGAAPGFGGQPGVGAQGGFGQQPGFGQQAGFGQQPGFGSRTGGAAGSPGAAGGGAGSNSIGSGFSGTIGSGFGTPPPPAGPGAQQPKPTNPRQPIPPGGTPPVPPPAGTPPPPPTGGTPPTPPPPPPN